MNALDFVCFFHNLIIYFIYFHLFSLLPGVCLASRFVSLIQSRFFFFRKDSNQIPTEMSTKSLLRSTKMVQCHTERIKGCLYEL